MKRRWMIPFFGMSLLLALLLGAVISISTLPVWNPIHKHVMADEMKPIHFHDADAVPGRKILDIEQAVVLQFGHSAGDLGHAFHRLIVGLLAGLVDLR